CSMFVLPTLMDNSPNSLVEAMAVGVPSIATNVGGIPSMAKNNCDALLVDKNDVAELANRIKLLFTDKELQSRLSANAKKRAYENNYPSKVSRKYIEVY